MHIIESSLVSPEFYRRNYRNVSEAAKYLGVSTKDFISFLKNWDVSLNYVIYSMRIEDVIDHLVEKPDEDLDSLARLYGFLSKHHLLWHFYIREKCTPRRWLVKQGIID